MSKQIALSRTDTAKRPRYFADGRRISRDAYFQLRESAVGSDSFVTRSIRGGYRHSAQYRFKT